MAATANYVLYLLADGKLGIRDHSRNILYTQGSDWLNYQLIKPFCQSESLDDLRTFDLFSLVQRHLHGRYDSFDPWSYLSMLPLKPENPFSSTNDSGFWLYPDVGPIPNPSSDQDSDSNLVQGNTLLTNKEEFKRSFWSDAWVASAVKDNLDLLTPLSYLKEKRKLPRHFYDPSFNFEQTLQIESYQAYNRDTCGWEWIELQNYTPDHSYQITSFRAGARHVEAKLPIAHEFRRNPPTHFVKAVLEDGTQSDWYVETSSFRSTDSLKRIHITTPHLPISPDVISREIPAHIALIPGSHGTYYSAQAFRDYLGLESEHLIWDAFYRIGKEPRFPTLFGLAARKIVLSCTDSWLTTTQARHALRMSWSHFKRVVIPALNFPPLMVDIFCSIKDDHNQSFSSFPATDLRILLQEYY